MASRIVLDTKVLISGTLTENGTTAWLLRDLNAIAYWVEIPKEITGLRLCPDPDDDKLIRAAMAAKAAWLVSGDSHLLDMEAQPDLLFLHPVAALEPVLERRSV